MLQEVEKKNTEYCVFIWPWSFPSQRSLSKRTCSSIRKLMAWIPALYTPLMFLNERSVKSEYKPRSHDQDHVVFHFLFLSWTGTDSGSTASTKTKPSLLQSFSAHTFLPPAAQRVDRRHVGAVDLLRYRRTATSPSAASAKLAACFIPLLRTTAVKKNFTTF